MKKLHFLVPCFCFLVLFFSCKKNENDPAPVTLNKEVNLSKTALATAAVNQDTVPPSNAVDIKTYGAYGDGVHDDTQAIQKAVDATSYIVFNKGTYLISQPIVMRSGVRLWGKNGPSIQAANNMSGKLLTQGMYFYISGTNRNLICNFHFKPAASKSFNLGSWSNSVIYIINSQYTGVQYNEFDFNQPYGQRGVEAVWISGASSFQNYVAFNRLYSTGIEYAEAGASNGIVINNIITRSHADALSAHGNTSTFCQKNTVRYNTIINAGYMGIEDYGYIDSSDISFNTITGTGKDPGVHDGMGISVTGVNSLVNGNTLSDAQFEYMEVGGNSKNISNNIINDAKLVAEGITVNLYGAANPRATIKTTTIYGNKITGTIHGVVVEGPDNPQTNIISNTITNPKVFGIDINSYSSNYNISISYNIINITNPNVTSRCAIASYSNPLYPGQKLSITGNNITYATTAKGGLGTECALGVGTNNVTINNNKVIGNNVVGAHGKVVAMSSNANHFTGYTITNNTFTGCFVDLSGYSTIVASVGNIIN